MLLATCGSNCPLRLGVLQNTVGEHFMGIQKFGDVIFQGRFRMKLRPVMCCTHERKHQIQLLQVARSQDAPQSLVRTRCLRRLKKDVCGTGE